MEASNETPKRGEWWEVVRGGGAGTKVQIEDVPDTVPSEEAYAVVRVPGQPQTRNIPLDDRWGASLVKVTEDASANERRELRRQGCYDRLTRIGTAHFGIEDLEEVVALILTDYAIWGEGAPIEHLLERAREDARKALA